MNIKKWMRTIAIENQIRDQKLDKMQDVLTKIMEEVHAISTMQRMNTQQSK
jgi:hypothetical protein